MLGLKAFISFAPHASRSSPHRLTLSSRHHLRLTSNLSSRHHRRSPESLCLPHSASHPSGALTLSATPAPPLHPFRETVTSTSSQVLTVDSRGNPRSRDMPLASSVASHENLTGVTGMLISVVS
nr:hypothetical protein Iba_chr15aCG14620 [Ipomoea batatas]